MQQQQTNDIFLHFEQEDMDSSSEDTEQPTDRPTDTTNQMKCEKNQFNF